MQNKMFALTIPIAGLLFFACRGDSPQAQTSRADGITADQAAGGQTRDRQPAPTTHTEDTTRNQPGGGHVRANQSAPTPRAEVVVEQKVSAPNVTFVELGSVNCIPCKAMQPVMRSIEKRYGKQIQVIFYDVWTPEQQHYARDFNIRVIPTQIFLDQTGNEILRHQGFFAEEEIDRFLQAQGLKVLSGL